MNREADGAEQVHQGRLIGGSRSTVFRVIEINDCWELLLLDAVISRYPFLRQIVMLHEIGAAYGLVHNGFGLCVL